MRDSDSAAGVIIHTSLRISSKAACIPADPTYGRTTRIWAGRREKLLTCDLMFEIYLSRFLVFRPTGSQNLAASRGAKRFRAWRA